jgi:Sulfotransferase family
MRPDSEPVVIGGLRGSGTRVAAHLVRGLGFHLGSNLNDALDDQSFGFFLGGRPDWRRKRPDQATVALRLVAKLVRGDSALTPDDDALVEEATEEWATRLTVPEGMAVAERVDWLRERFRSVREAGGMPGGAAGWGWKSPSAHVYIEELAKVFPRTRYIHVVRDGRDLVDKTKTQKEVELWGSTLGLPADARKSRQDALLEYWGLANRRVETLAPRLFGGRFMTFHYELACSRPHDAVAGMGDFLEVTPPAELAEEFADYVSGPRSYPACKRSGHS